VKVKRCKRGRDGRLTVEVVVREVRVDFAGEVEELGPSVLANGAAGGVVGEKFLPELELVAREGAGAARAGEGRRSRDDEVPKRERVFQR
jgi:hypothetical protein